MLVAILFLVFMTMGLVGYVIIPEMYFRGAALKDKQQREISTRLEQLMSRTEARKLGRFLIFAPIVLAIIFYFLLPGMGIISIVLGIVFGLVFPSFYVGGLRTRSLQKFNSQLVDALMIMSSSFRGGLSLVQALEAVVEEMPDPINREFGIVLGENKMGVSLEDALNHLYKRVPSLGLQQMITAILLARETGGNLPAIFAKISGNIRENRKIQENMATLTIQGKIQGVVMSILPFGFGFIVYTSNRRIFNHMLTSEIGQMMLVYCLVSWLIGVFLIWKISKFTDA